MCCKGSDFIFKNHLPLLEALCRGLKEVRIHFYMHKKETIL